MFHPILAGPEPNTTQTGLVHHRPQAEARVRSSGERYVLRDDPKSTRDKKKIEELALTTTPQMLSRSWLWAAKASGGDPMDIDDNEGIIRGPSSTRQLPCLSKNELINHDVSSPR